MGNGNEHPKGGPSLDEPGKSLIIKQDEAAVTVYEEPEFILDRAVKAATALKKILKPVKIGKSEHIRIEGWIAAGRFDNKAVGSDKAEPVELDGVKGFKAHSVVRDTRTGTIIAEAVAYCMRSEKQWADKPDFQLASMAQTRSDSKALASVERWIIELAGYSGTPAEEMVAEFEQHKPVSRKKSSSPPDKRKQVMSMIWDMANHDEAEALKLLSKYLRQAGHDVPSPLVAKSLPETAINAIGPYVEVEYGNVQGGCDA